MKAIIFCRTGESISDFEINERLDKFLSSNEESWFISSGIVIDELRARIAEKKIKHDEIEVYVDTLSGLRSKFDIDENGKSNTWYDSQEIFENILTRLLRFN